MTTGRINQVGIVPPWEGQSRSTALTSHSGLTNSFATECRRPLQGMTPKESSHVNSQLHFRARKRQAQQPQPESNTAFRCISGTQGTAVYQITRTRDWSAKGTLKKPCAASEAPKLARTRPEMSSPREPRKPKLRKITGRLTADTLIS